MPRFVFLPLAVLALAGGLSTAAAQERPWYFTLDAGLSRSGDPDFAGGRLTTKQGAAFGGALGRHLGSNWRVEAAVMYRNNPVQQVSSPGFDPRPGDADWASLHLTLNAFYDFDAFKLGPANVRPYLGVGIGRAQEVDTDLTSGGTAREFSGSGSARQLMAGLRWDYGSPWVADFGLSLTDAGRIRLAASDGAGAVEARYRATTVVARLGYRF
jgi:opacity protein-like surface antigen